MVRFEFELREINFIVLTFDESSTLLHCFKFINEFRLRYVVKNCDSEFCLDYMIAVVETKYDT